MLTKDAVRRVCTENSAELNAILQVISISEFTHYKLVYLSDGEFQMAVRIERKVLAPQYSVVEGRFFRRPDGVIEARTLSVSRLEPLIGNPKLWASENLPPTQPPLRFPAEKAVDLQDIVVDKISELVPSTCNFKLTAKVTSRSDLKIAKTGRGACFFTFTISDDSGSCTCFFFGDTAVKKLDDISLHKTYEFSKGKVKKGTASDGQITISLDDKSEMKLIADAASKQPILAIADLMKSDLREDFTVRGNISQIGPIETVRQKTSSTSQRVVRLRDFSGEVNLIVTDSKAEIFEFKLPPDLPGFCRVLTATNCRFADSGTSRCIITTLFAVINIVNEPLTITETIRDVPEFTTPNKKINFNSRIQLSDTCQQSRQKQLERSESFVLGVPPSKKRRTSLERCHVVKQVPDHSFADVAGFSDAKEKIGRYIQHHRSRTPCLGGGFIMVTGPEAVGIPFFCQSIPRSFDLTYLSVDLSELMALFPGHAETRLRQIFRKAQRVDRRPPPVIMYFKNLDAFSGQNGPNFCFDLSSRLISVFLTLLKDVKETAIVIGDCEKPWSLPQAILDQVDSVLSVELPDLAIRRAVLADADLGLSAADQRMLAELSDGRNIKELRLMVTELKGQSEAAVRKYVINHQPAVNKIILDKFKAFANKYRN
jgi:hypothetical protein